MPARALPIRLQVHTTVKQRAPAARRRWPARYGLALLLLGITLPPSLWLHAALPHSAEFLLLAAVVASGWMGGWGPGLLAAVLAPFTLDYFLIPPLHTLGITPAEWRDLFPFLLGALAAAWLSSSRAAVRDAQERLLDSEAKFRRILTNLPDIAWTADAAGRLVYVSPKVEKTLGYSNQELYAGGAELTLGRVHPEDRDRLLHALHALFRDNMALDVEFRFCHRDNTWIWLHSRATRYAAGESLLADGVVSDISRRKKAETELQAKTAFLEAQTDATMDGLLVVNASGRRILQNRRFNEIFSIPEELLSASEDAPVLHYVERLMKDPEAFVSRVLHLYAHRDETSREELELASGKIVDRYSSPVIGSDGRYYGRIWTFRDITERRRNEDRLRQLSAAVEQSPVSVVITDPRGNIGYVNRKFTELTGYSAAEVLGKNPRILNSGRAPREMYVALWTTILAGQEWRGEFCNRKKNGELYWEAATISPITGPDGSIRHFVAVKEDITARRSLEGDLRQAQKLEAIGQLAAGIAHEINTPIQFISDNLTFLEDACVGTLALLDSCRSVARDRSPEAAARMQRAEKNCDLEFLREEAPRAIAQSLEGARRVAKIVRAMKEFSHPELTERVDFDLNRGIAATVIITRHEWKDVAEVTTDLDETLPPLRCDPGEINQVMLNLIVNAAWAIRERTDRREKGQITVRTRRQDGMAEIAVTDTGVGIPAEIQSRIFEPFFTTRDVGSGTGQGLTQVHSVIVRKHGGRVRFETEVGRGTTFFVQLPFDAPGEQAET